MRMARSGWPASFTRHRAPNATDPASVIRSTTCTGGIDGARGGCGWSTAGPRAGPTPWGGRTCSRALGSGRPVRLEERAHVAHCERDLLLRVLPREEGELGLRGKNRQLDGGIVGVR